MLSAQILEIKTKVNLDVDSFNYFFGFVLVNATREKTKPT